MKTSIALLMAALAKAILAAPASTDYLPAAAGDALPAAQAGITPHEQYGSSIGVLGCKIDTNRVACWPQSFAYLSTGFSVTERPTTGGAITVDIENVPADNCRHLVRSSGLAFSGPSSMNFTSSRAASVSPAAGSPTTTSSSTSRTLVATAAGTRPAP